MDYKASTVEKYLSIWFLENDDLIVPNLGQFTSHHQTAQINEQINYFAPPNKEILFSEEVKMDTENRFASYIASQEGISLDHSQKLIQTYVTNFKFSLSGQKRQNIIGLGTFLFTEEEEIRFQAEENTNFLANSYGLPSLFYKPITDSQESPKSLTTTQDEESDTNETADYTTDEIGKETPKSQVVIEEDEEEEEEDDRSSRLVLGIVVIIVIAIVATLAITQFSDVLVGKEEVAEKEDTEKEKIEEAEEEQEADTVTTTESGNVEVPPIPNYDINQPNPNENRISRNNQAKGIAKNFTWNPTAPSNLNEVRVNSPTQTFYVVLGSFSNQASAYSMHNNLQKYNIKSKIIIGNGLYRIGIGGFASSADATRESGKVQTAHGLQAWILKY